MEFTGILRLTQYGIYIQISSIVLFVAVLFSPKSRVIPPDKRQEVTDYIVRFINNNTYLESNNNISDKCTIGHFILIKNRKITRAMFLCCSSGCELPVKSNWNFEIQFLGGARAKMVKPDFYLKNKRN